MNRYEQSNRISTKWLRKDSIPCFIEKKNVKRIWKVDKYGWPGNKLAQREHYICINTIQVFQEMHFWTSKTATDTLHKHFCEITVCSEI